MVSFEQRPKHRDPRADDDGRMALKLRIAALAGPLVDQAMHGRLTGSIQITVDFAAGRPLLVEPAIRWKEAP